MDTHLTTVRLLLPILATKWRTMILLPTVNILLVILFWQSQILQYPHSTKGVLYMWLVAGLLFLAIQTSLLIGAWRKATSGLEGQKLLEIQWVLGTQIFMFVVAAIYNIIALAELSLLGVRPNTALDGVIIMLLLVTLGMAFARYRRRPTDPDARLLLATGTKAAPQWLQAAGLLLLGSTGVHPTTIGAITAMGATRFLLAKQAVGHYQDKNTVASYKIAFRDLTSILAMGVGWLGARL